MSHLYHNKQDDSLDTPNHDSHIHNHGKTDSIGHISNNSGKIRPTTAAVVTRQTNIHNNRNNIKSTDITHNNYNNDNEDGDSVENSMKNFKIETPINLSGECD